MRWLLDDGIDPNARWTHWEAEMSPLHVAAWEGHAEVARLLLATGADPHACDTQHHSDALGWAEHHGHTEVARVLRPFVAER